MNLLCLWWCGYSLQQRFWPGRLLSCLCLESRCLNTEDTCCEKIETVFVHILDFYSLNQRTKMFKFLPTCCLPTSGGDDLLHKHSSFLQTVEGESSQVWSWCVTPRRRAWSGLSGHHGNWSWLDWPNTGHWLLFSTRRWTPEETV